ncbi:MAG: hypothetical protein AB7I42_22945 [Bradyrhizobium sp.]|uniref:hypothetical protein n=1 Tax=Bradyrhizobium sp. TaxID=376 RepID=UPI003D14568A
MSDLRAYMVLAFSVFVVMMVGAVAGEVLKSADEGMNKRLAELEARLDSCICVKVATDKITPPAGLYPNKADFLEHR